MLNDKRKTFYLFSLLVLGSLLVLFAEGVFSGLSAGSAENMAEIRRIDLFNDFVGNYSKISVMLTNNDTISHNFSINTYYDENLERNYVITIKSGKTFKYQTEVLPDRIPISQNETINSTLRVAKFVVYMDNNPEPFEEASFVFENEL